MLWRRSPQALHRRCILSGFWFTSSTVIFIFHLEQACTTTVTLEVLASHTCMYTASKIGDPPNFHRSPSAAFRIRCGSACGSPTGFLVLEDHTRFWGWIGRVRLLKQVSFAWNKPRVQQARGGGDMPYIMTQQSGIERGIYGKA